MFCVLFCFEQDIFQRNSNFLDKKARSLYLLIVNLPRCLWNFTTLAIKSCSEPLAQSVEQQPFKLWVVGSNPTRLTTNTQYVPIV